MSIDKTNSSASESPTATEEEQQNPNGSVQGLCSGAMTFLAVTSVYWGFASYGSRSANLPWERSDLVFVCFTSVGMVILTTVPYFATTPGKKTQEILAINKARTAYVLGVIFILVGIAVFIVSDFRTSSHAKHVDPLESVQSEFRFQAEKFMELTSELRNLKSQIQKAETESVELKSEVREINSDLQKAEIKLLEVLSQMQITSVETKSELKIQLSELKQLVFVELLKDIDVKAAFSVPVTGASEKPASGVPDGGPQ
jgi:hypothetical protein